MVIEAILLAGVPLVGGQALATLGPRDRFPRISPGDLLRTAVDIQALTRRGLEPVLTADPFRPGSFFLATRDQRFAPEIAAELADREFFGLTRAESANLFNLRQGFIDSFPGVVNPTATESLQLQAASESPAIAVAQMQAAVLGCSARATSVEALRLCQGG